MIKKKSEILPERFTYHLNHRHHLRSRQTLVPVNILNGEQVDSTNFSITIAAEKLDAEKFLIETVDPLKINKFASHIQKKNSNLISRIRRALGNVGIDNHAQEAQKTTHG